MNWLRSVLRLPPPSQQPGELFDFRPIGCVPDWAQAAAVVLLFVSLVLLTHNEYRESGTVYGVAGAAFNVLFCPIYEELIFRGWMLGRLARYSSNGWAIAISSLLFGLVHVRNIYWRDTPALIHMMLYAGLVLGPLFAWVTLRCRSVWPAVILHYLNNLVYYVRH